jgi:hypothetical protein
VGERPFSPEINLYFEGKFTERERERSYADSRSYRQDGVAEVAVHVAHMLCRGDRLGRHSCRSLAASPRLAVWEQEQSTGSHEEEEQAGGSTKKGEG